MATPDTLVDIQTRNQVFLERLKSGEHKKFIPFLKRISTVVRARLLKEGETIESKRRLNALLSDLAAVQNGIYDDYIQQLTLDLETIGIDQAEFEGAALNSVVVDFESDIPAPQQLLTAFRVEPMSVEGLSTKPLLEPFIKDWSKTSVQRVNTIVQQGFAQGKTTAEIIKEVRGTKGANFNDGALAKVNRDAAAIVRTSIQHVASTAQHKVLEENDDVVTGYEWVSTLDSRTSSQCKNLDGMIFEIGKGPTPPIHVNCLTGDALVNTCSSISYVYKRRYKGSIVDVRTQSGVSISITPNHPILTRGGWKPAKDIDISDELVRVTDNKIIIENQEDNMVATFSNIFSSFNVSVDSSSITNTPPTPKDFHGDVSNSEVSVIKVDSFARDRVKSILSKSGEDHSFIFATSMSRAFQSISSFYLSFNRSFTAARSIIGRFNEGCLLLRRGIIHSCLLLFSPVPQSSKFIFEKSTNRRTATAKADMFRNPINADSTMISVKDRLPFSLRESNNSFIDDGDSRILQNPLDWLFSNAKDLPYILNRNIFNGVEFDNVVDVTVREIDDHVYNLENKDNWYLANGIITHNCRSTTSPTISDEFDFLKKGAKRAARGADGGEQAPASTTYYSWLKTQPAAFQDSAIGTTRGKLLRNGGLTSEEFKKLSMGRNFQNITLEEMQRKRPEVFERANIEI